MLTERCIHTAAIITELYLPITYIKFVVEEYLQLLRHVKNLACIRSQSLLEDYSKRVKKNVQTLFSFNFTLE